MQRVTIQKNYYYSAGYKYKWNSKHDPYGFGIAVDILKNNSEIEVFINGGLFTLDCNQAISFIRHYKSMELYKGKRVGIMTKSLLRYVYAPNNPIPEVKPTTEIKKVDKPPLQGTLL